MRGAGHGPCAGPGAGAGGKEAEERVPCLVLRRAAPREPVAAAHLPRTRLLHHVLWGRSQYAVRNKSAWNTLIEDFPTLQMTEAYEVTRRVVVFLGEPRRGPVQSESPVLIPTSSRQPPCRDGELCKESGTENRNSPPAAI